MPFDHTTLALTYINRNKLYIDDFSFSWKASLKPLILEERLYWQHHAYLFMKYEATYTKMKTLYNQDF